MPFGSSLTSIARATWSRVTGAHGRRVVSVRGHFRGLSYVKPFKRRRPVYEPPVDFVLAGQPLSYEHTLINLLRDVEPLMGY